MGKDHRDALMLYLNNSTDINLAEQDWGFVNAVPLPDMPENWIKSLLCQQAFRPDYLNLRDHGYNVISEWPGSSEHKSGMIFFPSRNRLWNEHMIAQIWNSLRHGQSLVISGEKKNGGASLRKWLSGYVELDDSYAKHHSLVFRAIRGKSDPDIPAIAIERKVGEYHVSDGVFSSEGPDRGSMVLSEFLDSRIRGRVADLGAGWGYLSRELANRSENVRAIDLFEANESALHLARKNMREVSGIEISFNWIDVIREFPKKPYDWVIMNPPFHSSGRSTQPELGISFIHISWP